MPQSEPRNSSLDGAKMRIQYFVISPAAAPASKGLKKQLRQEGRTAVRFQRRCREQLTENSRLRNQPPRNAATP